MAKLDIEIPITNFIMELPINYDKATWVERIEARNEYVRIQGGLCHHCQRGLYEDVSDFNMKKINTDLFPEGFFDHPVHLHHNHKTGLTIGAVHAYCNAILWQYYGE